MKVAVLGQGSIGRRHTENLLALGHEVTVFDPLGDVATDPRVHRAGSESSALRSSSAAIVASPPSEHLRQARMALDRGIHVLVEKPFAVSAKGAAALAVIARHRGLILAAAMNLRFHPGVSTVHRLVAQGTIGRALRASFWCGSWLPGWRPESDYRQSYSAQGRLGGGILLDAIHELDYAIWILGPVARVGGLLRQSATLDIDTEDVAVLTLEHERGTISSITLDYLDRSYHRGCRIVGEHGTIDWSWETETIEVNIASAARQLSVACDAAPSYRAELDSFLAATRAEGLFTPFQATMCTALEAAEALAVADAVRLASNDGTTRGILPAQLTLRRAGLADAEELLRWRNDPLTRASSFNSEQISRADHAAWLAQVISDRDRLLLIAIEAGRSVGQVRLDKSGMGVVELHISLAPEARGHGLGTALLILAMDHAATLGAERVFARIKPGNIASERSFSGAGFHAEPERPGHWLCQLPATGVACADKQRGAIPQSP